jgi:hypothetical protein
LKKSLIEITQSVVTILTSFETGIDITGSKIGAEIALQLDWILSPVYCASKAQIAGRESKKRKKKENKVIEKKVICLSSSTFFSNFLARFFFSLSPSRFYSNAKQKKPYLVSNVIYFFTLSFFETI